MTPTTESPIAAGRPTRVRFAVVAMAILLGTVTYLDRGCIGTLEQPIMHDLGLHNKYQLGYAMTAFAAAYCAFGILSAWWADRVGTRIMLTAVVAAWSIFTMATGTAQGMVSLVAIQLCFGAAESGAWPAITRTLSRWIPYSERGRAQGIVWMGAHTTLAVTPLLVNAMIHYISWRRIFFLFGLTGQIWVAVWYWWFRDEPSQHRGVNEAELAHIMAGRTIATAPAKRQDQQGGVRVWRRLLTHRNMVALCLMYLPNSFIFYFCITWFHNYLEQGRGLRDWELAFFTGLPLGLSVASDLLGGIATDWAVRRFGTRWGRTGVGVISYLIAGCSILLAAWVPDPRLAALLFAFGTAANMFPLASAWGTCQDIGGGRAGVVSATMNTAGQLAALTCPLLVPFLEDQYGWTAAPTVIGLSFLLGSLCWFFIDPRKRIFD